MECQKTEINMNGTSEQISAFAAYSQMKNNEEHSKKHKKIKKNKSSTIKSIITSPNDNLLKNKENVTPEVKKKKQSNVKLNSTLELKPKKKIKKLVKEKISSMNSHLKEGSGSEKEFLPKKSIKRKEVSSSAESLRNAEGASKPKKKKKKLNPTSSNDEKSKLVKTPEEALNTESQNNSTKMGKITFEWIIHPITAKNFFNKTWEKGPAYVQRNCSTYFNSLLSTKQIDEILRNNNLFFGRNVDVTSYTNGKRETLNPEGRALPPVVWDFYTNGCSVRLLNPQTYCKKLNKIISYLQEFFGSFVGANAYLTPPGTQGFAPHYDDIEAFILQIEGKKHWKLYAPRNKDEVLPRYSSPNFSDDDLTNPPILDVILEAGDMLYFPRGTIHQGRCVDDSHSLHVTLSFYQKLSWGDYLEKLIPMALKSAIDSDSEFREGLPIHFADYMGMVHVGEVSQKRAMFCNKLETLLAKMFQRAAVDTVVDIMCKEFQHSALPPVLTTEEKALTAYGDGERMVNDGVVINRVVFDMDTKVKLLRRHILRLVYDENTFRVYHYAHNSKEYHGEELQFFEIDKDILPGIEILIKKYPEYIAASELPIEDESRRIQVVSDLWERGLLMTETPLPDLNE